LEPGARADLLVLDGDHPQLAGRQGDVLLDSLVFSGNTNSIDHVMVGGRWLVRDGHHHDEDKIAENYRKAIAALA
jgi:formimidoylglutamate deiminase